MPPTLSDSSVSSRYANLPGCISEDEIKGYSRLTYRRDVFDTVHCQEMHSCVQLEQSPGSRASMLIAIHCDQLGLSVHAIEYPGSAQAGPSAQFEKCACRFGGGQSPQQRPGEQVGPHGKADRCCCLLDILQDGRGIEIIGVKHFRDGHRTDPFCSASRQRLNWKRFSSKGRSM